MRKSLICLIVAGAALINLGCVRYTSPTQPARKMTPAERNFEAVWQASRNVLKEFYFELDRQDRRAGVITTYPMVAQHAGEFWRKDAVTDSDLAEGTIQTIYHQAKVSIEPTSPENGSYRPVVEVRTFRSNRQEMQVSSTSDAYDLFRLPGADSRKRRLLDRGRTEPDDVLADLGRDEDLENLLTAKIRLAAAALRGQL